MDNANKRDVETSETEAKARAVSLLLAYWWTVLIPEVGAGCRPHGQMEDT